MRPGAVIVRRARRADLSAVGHLGAQLLRAHHEFDRDRFMAPGKDPEGGYAWFLGTQLSRRNAVVFVAERDAAIVGYVYAEVEPRSWKELRDEAGFIHDVLVDPAARRAGVATALLEAAFAWLRTHGVPRVVLWTAHANQPARRLFTSLGFRPTMIEMTKELGEAAPHAPGPPAVRAAARKTRKDT
jgi:ribosomal protein S18 acetylase RimI-like enzyme